MLGCNEYHLTGYSELSNCDVKSLTLLYQELTSMQAIRLYTLLIYQNKSFKRQLNELLTELNLSLDVFENCLAELETVGLIDTYQNHNVLVFVVKKPKPYAEVIHDQVLGRLLIKKVDQTYYRYLISLLKPNINLDGYRKINHTLSADLLNNWNSNEEVIFNDVAACKDREEEIKKGIFDINHFLKTVSNALFPVSLRTAENLNAIVELADTYNINENDMRIFISKAISLAPLSFNLAHLKNLCLGSQNSAIKTNDDDPYHMPCVAFFEQMQGMKATYNDRAIIGRLTHDYHFSVDVANILLEYSFKACNRQLSPSYIDTIASNWLRNKVDTKEKAFAEIKKNTQHHKPYKQIKTIEQIPDYNSGSNIEISDELMAKYFGK